jgi:hypothetical protein
MDIQFLSNPSLSPRQREDIRIETVTTAYYSDRKRLRISVATTPFFPRDKPNIKVRVFDMDNAELASVVIIESIQSEISVTMHLPAPVVEGIIHKGIAQLYFIESEIQHELPFMISPYQPQENHENS